MWNKEDQKFWIHKQYYHSQQEWATLDRNLNPRIQIILKISDPTFENFDHDDQDSRSESESFQIIPVHFVQDRPAVV